MQKDTHTQEPFFYASFTGLDRLMIIEAVNQGIDARLEGLTVDVFSHSDIGAGRLFIECHTPHAFQILVRRLLDTECYREESLADDMIFAQYGIEVI